MKSAEPHLVIFLEDLTILKEPEPVEPNDTPMTSIQPYTYTEWILDVERTICNPNWTGNDYNSLKNKFWILSKKTGDSLALFNDSMLEMCIAFIENTGTFVSDEKLNISVEWIWSIGMGLTLSQAPLPVEIRIKLFEFINVCLQNETENRKHRNICVLLSLLCQVENSEIFLTTEMIHHFKRLLETNWINNKSLILYLLLTLEALSQNDINKKKICDDSSLISTIKSNNNPKIDLETNENMFDYQISFCIDNLLTKFENSESSNIDNRLTDLIIEKIFTQFNRTPELKVSANNQSIRCDWKMQTYRSMYELAEANVYYYEVMILTDGPIRIGWSSQCQSPSMSHPIGADDHSLGYDGFWQWVCFNNLSYPAHIDGERRTRWKAGDIVGCLLDVSQPKNQIFRFYLNGNEIEFQTEQMHYFEKPFTPTITLKLNQQVIVNFGESTFQHAPDFPFSSPHEIYCQTRKLFEEQLIEFYYEKLSNHLTDDLPQKQFDLILLELEWNIEMESSYNWKCFSKLAIKFQHLMKSVENSWIRLMKAIITIIGIKSSMENQTFNRIMYHLIKLISSSFKFDNESKIELASNLSYLIRAFVDSSNVQQRNASILLAIFSSQNLELDKSIEEFTRKIFYETECHKTKLCSLITLKRFNWISAEDDYDVLEKLACDFYGSCSIANLYHSDFDSIQFQIGFLLQLIVDSKSKNISSSEDGKEISLSTKWINCTSNLYLSTDHFSVRNDSFEYQTLSFNLPFNSGIYFYETILLTSGSIHIGWSNHNGIATNLSYNGYYRLQTIGDETKPINDSLVPSWKANDIIGCSIEIDSKTESLILKYYCNGKLLLEQQNDKIGNGQYVPSLGLDSFQQIFLNFGQAPYQYPPKGLNYLDVNSLMNDSIGESFCQLCKVNAHTLQFSKCNHWKFCLTCAPRLSRCPTCS